MGKPKIVINETGKNTQIVTDLFIENGVDYDWHELGMRDYLNPDNPNIILKRVHSIEELLDFFVKCSYECLIEDLNCNEINGINIALLIEVGESQSYFEIDELLEEYADIISQYSIDVIFCTPEEIGIKVIDILYDEEWDR